MGGRTFEKARNADWNEKLSKWKIAVEKRLNSDTSKAKIVGKNGVVHICCQSNDNVTTQEMTEWKFLNNATSTAQIAYTQTFIQRIQK